MSSFIEDIKSGKIQLADGAMGSLLMKKGLKQGECPEYLNLTQPKILEEIAQLYLDAGADIIQSNTFGASPMKLSEYSLDDKTEEINSAGVSLAKNVVGDRAYIYGSCGPSGKILQPFGDGDPDELQHGFERQIKAMVSAEVDVIFIETMTDLNEAILAIKAARAVSANITVAACMTFEATPKGFFTIMGNKLEEAASELEAAGADVIGSNCGNGIDKMIEIASELKKVSDLPLIIQSNAGLPVNKDGEIVYPETPEYFAQKVIDLIDAGVSIVGGCCGTTPDTIRAMRKTIDSL
ncbi:MAG: homocysteine S-methyltransferase family protein [Planctomycetota bacterium]|jgi:5-methyltetrahydrofolate--homocysteine methyltransferase